MKKYKPKKIKNIKRFELNKRESSTKRGYDKNWSKYRFRFLHHNPKCYCCGHKSEVIDHIKSHKGDKELFWNQENYMPLCKRCHDTITGKFDRFSEPDLEAKIKWIQEQRKKNGIETKIKIVPIPNNNN